MNIRIVLIYLAVAATVLAGPILYPYVVPAMADVHERAVVWFVGRPGEGVSRIASAEESQPLSAEIVSLQGKGFRIKEMQLLGILKYDPPVAYLVERGRFSPHTVLSFSSSSSIKDLLKNYTARPLTPDEESAISVMKSDFARNIVVSQLTQGSVRVVGPIAREDILSRLP